MTGSLLLDTNIVVGLFIDDPAIAGHFLQSPDVALSVTVLGELYYGAQKSNRVDENLARIDQFLEGVTVIDNDIATAYEYGAIRNELRLKGRPIPENDLWIAALARQHDLTVVSRDRHFAEVENLRWEQW
jgi:tRNA(fMet)-specific endonuclease VapC